MTTAKDSCINRLPQIDGAKVQWATLEFTPEAAQWVRHEQWHPQQEAKVHGDGSLTLRVPYADATELAMHILRHGEQVRDGGTGCAGRGDSIDLGKSRGALRLSGPRRPDWITLLPEWVQ